MKAIKITVENSAAIETALKEVNGKATAHAYTRAYDILALADRADANLDKLGIPKAIRPGARYISESGERLPARYRYTAQTTRVVIQRRSSAWWLIEVQPSSLYPKSNPFRQMVLTSAQDEKAIEALRRAYMVQAN